MEINAAKPTTASRPDLPEPTSGEVVRLRVVCAFARMQLPLIAVPEAVAMLHLKRSFALYAGKTASPTWADFLADFYALDWFVAVGCLERVHAAWELLFQARTGRSDCLLVDALRARACRLYPRDEEKRENAVGEFWSRLLAADTPLGSAVLERYDGKRPLSPWLIRVFQNWHLSQLRSSSHTASLIDDDYAQPPTATSATESRWHEEFLEAGREWLHDLPESETLLLGLRWRYKLSQRDAANLLKVHEGTVSRRTDKLRDTALTRIGERLTARGWTGDDLHAFILTEMGNLLLDEPSLSAEALRRLLQSQGLRVPTAE